MGMLPYKDFSHSEIERKCGNLKKNLMQADEAPYNDTYIMLE